jgi:hypothetical protein
VSRRLLRHSSVVLAGFVVAGSLGGIEFKNLLLKSITLPGFPGLFRLTPHRLLHFTAFGLLSVCLCLTFERSYQRILMLGSVIALGVLVESIEFLGSTNPFEFWDVRDDLYAACAGYALVETYYFARRFRSICG